MSIRFVLLVLLALSAPAFGQTPQQRIDKIITDANVAENALQRVRAEAKRLKLDVTPPVVTYP